MKNKALFFVKKRNNDLKYKKNVSFTEQRFFQKKIRSEKKFPNCDYRRVLTQKIITKSHSKAIFVLRWVNKFTFKYKKYNKTYARKQTSSNYFKPA